MGTTLRLQVESSVAQIRAPITLTDRSCDGQRDGYVEIVPRRETFTNVTRLLVDKGSTVKPDLRENEAQTATSMEVNFGCQCLLDQEQEGIGESSVTQRKNMDKFMKSRADEVYEKVLMHWILMGKSIQLIIHRFTSFLRLTCVIKTRK